MCVREREEVHEREGVYMSEMLNVCLRVCVCVCEKERERKGEMLYVYV